MKKTFGKIYTDLSSQSQDPVHVIDQQREMQKDFMASLWNRIDHDYSMGSCARSNACVCPEDDSGKKINPGPFGKYNKTFYIEVITKKERLFEKTFRNYMLTRHTCPTPQYDQSVFQFNTNDEKLYHIWTLPDRDTHLYMSQNRLNIPKEQYQLLNFVLSDLDGTLLRIAKQLNGEKEDSIELKR